MVFEAKSVGLQSVEDLAELCVEITDPGKIPVPPLR